MDPLIPLWAFGVGSVAICIAPAIAWGAVDARCRG